MDDAKKVPIDMQVLIEAGGDWVDVPGTELQARIELSDPPNRFYLRKRPKDG